MRDNRKLERRNRLIGLAWRGQEDFSQWWRGTLWNQETPGGVQLYFSQRYRPEVGPKVIDRNTNLRHSHVDYGDEYMYLS